MSGETRRGVANAKESEMRIGKFLLCGLLLALPVLAEEAEDRQTATSLRYVSHELDTRHDKLSTGSNKALTYTNAAGDVEQRTVKENLNGGTTDTSLPQVNAVNAGLDTKQNDIATIDDHTAVTYTSQVGTIGQKGIYQDTGTYAAQSDNLIDAKTFNAALKNGLDSEFVCGGTSPNGTCWLWQIHNETVYTSATGTVTQDGTPTPENLIYPTFYEQGNLILRRVGDYADSYDATTEKITRRIGVKVLDGTEEWYVWGTYGYYSNFPRGGNYMYNVDTIATAFMNARIDTTGSFTVRGVLSTFPTVADFESWLAEQYAAGTPVTVYYPLETPVVEDWDGRDIYIPQNQ